MNPSGPPPARQPYLHELVTCVRAPTTVLSPPDGQIRAGGAVGAFRHDRRVVSELVAAVDGQDPVPVGHRLSGADAARFVAVVRHLGDPGADPTVRLERTRTARGDGFDEQLELINASRQPVEATVRVRMAVDFAAMDPVKRGDAAVPVPPAHVRPGEVTWVGPDARVTLRAGGVHPVGTGDAVELTWPVSVPARGHWRTRLSVTTAAVPAVATGVFAADTGRPAPAVRCTGPADLRLLLQHGLADLAALTLADPTPTGDRFVAAGSPWYLTLFGRDALWTARFLLPLGTDLARGTLRALARRQGRRQDPDTGEAPGKIPHEIRAVPPRAIGGHPVYFGTVDATALWISLLHDAWRWGLPTAEVADLLGPLQRALRWLLADADSDGDGFLEYLDHTGHGLANQGWKDSGDAIQFRDGTIAAPPIALCEAQAYAYQAAVCGADLLEAFGRPGTGRLREWAATLRTRFRESFWVADDRGRFPAIALEGAKRPVDVATSNPGHLLGTGLLDQAEAAAVAARLSQPDLDCGYGLRTLSADAAGFNPLGYHVGTVWPHDTAIAAQGLVREGHDTVAESLAGGLLRVAPWFGHRLPELYGGVAAHAGQAPLAYPAACRPQAWSAAAAVALLQAGLGLEADVPGGTLTVRPAFRSWWPLRVSGLQVAGHPLSIEVDSAGRVDVETSAPVRVRRPAPAERVPHPRGTPGSGSPVPAGSAPGDAGERDGIAPPPEPGTTGSGPVV